MVAVAAYAYEIMNQSIMSDEKYDKLCLKIDVQRSTGNNKMDKWFRKHFSPHTGMWVHKHPDQLGLKRIAKFILRAQRPKLERLKRHKPKLKRLRRYKWTGITNMTEVKQSGPNDNFITGDEINAVVQLARQLQEEPAQQIEVLIYAIVSLFASSTSDANTADKVEAVSDTLTHAFDTQEAWLVGDH